MVNLNGKEQLVDIPDASQAECPTSVTFRYPEMVLLAAEVASMGWLSDVGGSAPFGSDPNKWPARWYDMVKLARIEDSLVDSAKDALRVVVKG